jgi:hypothetical protein
VGEPRTRREVLEALAPAGGVTEGAALLARALAASPTSVFRWLRKDTPPGGALARAVLAAMMQADAGDLSDLGFRLARLPDGDVVAAVSATLAAVHAWNVPA